jgi:hypothetical protein
MRETERKRNILQTLWSCRQLFIKLYVAHSWLKGNGQIAPRINAAIQELKLKLQGITESRNALERLITGLQPTLLPSFDISTAADVWSLGTYSRLPLALERIGGIRPFNSKDELEKFKESLGPVLLRLLMGNSADPFPTQFTLDKIGE